MSKSPNLKKELEDIEQYLMDCVEYIGPTRGPSEDDSRAFLRDIEQAVKDREELLKKLDTTTGLMKYLRRQMDDFGCYWISKMPYDIKTCTKTDQEIFLDSLRAYFEEYSHNF